MNDFARARAQFSGAGLPVPAIPAPLAGKLAEREVWVFSTRTLDVSPYELDHYVAEVEAGGVQDYAVLAHAGHGCNSYAIHYYLVNGPLRLFLQLAWGGAYGNREEDASRIGACFDLADRIGAAVQAGGVLDSKGHLKIVGSDFYGSYWVSNTAADSQGRKVTDTSPRAVLAGALAWLASRAE